mgnify:CR=1 FL=1
MRQPVFIGVFDMEILVLGLNYKTAPLELREKLSIPTHKALPLLKILEERHIFQERLVLSTCNRTEIYGVGNNSSDSIRQTKEFLSEYSQLRLSEFEDKLYVLRQPDSIEHLFSVASGLDSMVLGETEIIGQVKDAYDSAHKNQQTGKVLNTLFQRSFKVAKNLRTQTGIGVGRVSVASVAADLAEKIFGKLKNVRAMVIGTGEMSTQVTKAMLSRGVYPYIVSSRHYERAKTLAQELGGEAVPYDRYEEHIGQIDILITATEAPRVLVNQPQVKNWMKTRHDKPLFLIDIAVPRNIDESAQKIDNVYLYNIDDFEGIANRNMANRKGQIEECSKLVKGQTGHFMEWLIKEFGVRESAE